MTNILKVFDMAELFTQVSEINTNHAANSISTIELKIHTQYKFNLAEFEEFHKTLKAAREEYRRLGENVRDKHP